MASTRGKQGGKRDRERLRHQMAGRGCSLAEIAAEIGRRWRFNPRQAWRYTHGLSQEEAAARCNQVLGSDRVPMTGKRISDYEGWPQRGTRPTVHVLTVFAQVYATTPRQLLSEAELALVPQADRLVLEHLAAAAHPAAGGPPAARRSAAPLPEPHAPPGPPEQEAPQEAQEAGRLTPAAVRAAARASGAHAEHVETTEVGAVTLDQVGHEVVHLARSYIGVDPAEIFGELLRVRERVYRLLRRRAYPAQQADLYLLAGQTCALLASASLELGCHTAAAEQARAAWVYAEIIDHTGLRAWLRGTQALIAFWSGHPREAVQLAESGRGYLRRGTGFVRLCNIESRGWAYLGNRRETKRVIRLGQRARDQAGPPDELHDIIGGEFGFDQARQSFCNAGAYVQLGEARLALAACERALDLYASPAERHRRYGGEGSTRLEMTDAHLMHHELDAADSALTPLISPSDAVRVEHLPTRLTEIQATLDRPPYRHSRDAQELSERIRIYTTHHTR